MERSLLSYWSGEDWAVWCSTIATAIALLASVRRSRLGLWFIPIFALYEALASLVLFCAALQKVPNHLYAYAWWYTAIGENLLLCAISIEIAACLLPTKRFALAWCGGLGTLLALSIGGTLPARQEQALLNASLAADCICGLVLVALIFFEQVKPKSEMRFAIAGVLAPAALHALGITDWLNHGVSPFVQAALPLASLVGLCLFLIGATDAWIYIAEGFAAARRIGKILSEPFLKHLWARLSLSQ